MSHARINSEGSDSSPASASKPKGLTDTTATGNADPEGSTSSTSESSGDSEPINTDPPIPQSPKKDADGKPPADKSGGGDTDVLDDDKDSSGSDTEEEDDDDDDDDDSSGSDTDEDQGSSTTQRKKRKRKKQKNDVDGDSSGSDTDEDQGSSTTQRIKRKRKKLKNDVDDDSSESDTEEEDDDDDVDGDSSASDTEEENDDDDDDDDSSAFVPASMPGPNHQIQDQQYLSTLQNDRPAVQRRKVIKERLVTERANDQQRNVEKNLDVPVAGNAKNSHTTDGADEFAKDVGYGALVANDIANMGPAIGLTGSLIGLLGSERAKAFGEDTLKDEDVNDFSNFFGAMGNALGTIGQGVKTVSQSYQAHNSKNKHKRAVARRKASSGAFGFVGSLSGFGSNLANLGAFGDKATKKDANTGVAGGVMDIVAGVGDMFKTGLDFSALHRERAGHQEVTKRAERIWGGGTPANELAHSTAIADAKGDIATAKRRGDQAALRDARQRRHTEKAKYYAMKQATQLHQLRSTEQVWRKGITGLIGSGLSGFGALLKGANKLGLNTGVAGPALSVFGSIAKSIAVGVEKSKKDNEAAALNNKKRNIVNEYLDEKKNKIQTEFQSLQFSNGEMRILNNNTTLSDNEIKIVLLMRLGVDIPDQVNAITNEEIDEAFEKLTEKRAKNILKSKDADKNEMLDALGLDHDASLEDVVSSLSGN